VLWRHYRSTLGWALASSAALGAFVGLAIYAGGNADYRAHAGWGGFIYWVVLGAVVGTGTGIACVAGGAVAVAIRDRGQRRTSAARVRIGTLGASIGAVIPWIVVAVAAGSAWWPFALGIGAVVGLVTAVLARVMLGRAEQRQDGDVVEFRHS